MKKIFYFCLFLLFSDTDIYSKGFMTIKSFNNPNQSFSYGGNLPSDQRFFYSTRFGKLGSTNPFKSGVGINKQIFNPTTFADVTDIQISPEDYDDQPDQDSNVIMEKDQPYSDEY